MTETQVWAVVEGKDVRAGTLYAHRRRGVESSTFAYVPEYLAAHGAWALDPELPLRSGAFQTRARAALFGAFADCAPDRWGRTLMTRQEASLARAEDRAPRSLGELDFLLGVRDDLRQGALRFRRATDGPFLADDQTGVPALTELTALLDLAARAERGTADLPDLQRLIRVGSSLGGARPKAHVRQPDGRAAIAKFPSADRDTWNVMAWEKVALDLASRAGVTVPSSTLLTLADRNVLVLDRFDRDAAGGRVGYVSAMTMLEASDGDRRTYLDIAEVVESRSGRATEELAELWRRVVFSVLVSNTDDHLRNHGFLHVRGDVWRLAPAFDLNPDPAPGPKHLATAIDNSDDVASVQAALSVADHFRLTREQATTVLREVTVAVSGWQEVARAHRLGPQEIARVGPAFAALEQAADV